MDITSSDTLLHPAVYSLFRFPGPPKQADRRVGHELTIGSLGVADLLKGPVRSVASRNMMYGKRPGARWEQTFDRGGNLTGEIFYTEKDSITSWYTFEYDAAGRRKEETDLHADPCDRDSRWVYRYDEATGRLAELQKYDPETGRHFITLAYTYGADGRSVREEEVWADKYRLLLREFTLDGDGSVTVTSFSRMEGGSRLSIIFDAAGRPVKIVSYENLHAPAALRGTYEYDAAGKLLRERGSWPSVSYVREYGYNAEGDLISMRLHAPDGAFKHGARYDYEYDARGNWVKRTAWYFRAGQEKETPGDVITRSITYY